MDLPHFSELIKAIPLNRDPAEVIPPFKGHEKRSKHSVVESLHRIIVLLLHRHNGWSRPILSRAEKETVSPIQDRDPYMESLLIALHGRKRQRARHVLE